MIGWPAARRIDGTAMQIWAAGRRRGRGPQLRSYGECKMGGPSCNQGAHQIQNGGARGETRDSRHGVDTRRNCSWQLLGKWRDARVVWLSAWCSGSTCWLHRARAHVSVAWRVRGACICCVAFGLLHRRVVTGAVHLAWCIAWPGRPALPLGFFCRVWFRRVCCFLIRGLAFS